MYRITVEPENLVEKGITFKGEKLHIDAPGVKKMSFDVETMEEFLDNYTNYIDLDEIVSLSIEPK